MERTILDTVGNTPMIKVLGIYAKLETTNPSGSIKDRMAAYMVKKAEKKGLLKKGSRIIEATTGNTGIAFAMISAVKGYRFTAVMPEHMSVERRKMMEAFGASIVLTPEKEDMPGAIRKYNELVAKHPDAWLPRQFENTDNIEAHEKGTGQEIIRDMGGKVDAFVAGFGTGGTLLGVAKALKKANPSVRIVGVEPAESAVMTGGAPGPHGIQGIGEGFVPKIVQDNRALIDGFMSVGTRDAIEMSRKLAAEHGILVGVSSGANMLAALKLKKKYERVVTVLPDRGERYLSTL
jgi:cysteine synthase A